MMIEMQKIYELRDRIVKHFQPIKILLFGSYAYGQPTEDSDVDMLVIMPFEGRGAHKSAEIATVTHPRFAVDLLVRTPEQVKTRLDLGDFFIREIVENGKVLYEA
ncbi:MAG: nucleotidyltransferase domain-containing protein [Anaerolineales bacterium]|nr:nucleotidyltransferase domain-containing protein [Anaerolineales bacterium]MDP3185962.1 nucleotidyltransferase domain-containing protein [Anaerolineales bacterium]